MSHRGPVKPLPPVIAHVEIMAQALNNCAYRLNERGDHNAADRVARGIDDEAWIMRFEVAKLMGEAGK